MIIPCYIYCLTVCPSPGHPVHYFSTLATVRWRVEELKQIFVLPDMLFSSVADPDLGSGVFLTPGSGMVESQHPDPGSVMNNLDHIF